MQADHELSLSTKGYLITKSFRKTLNIRWVLVALLIIELLLLSNVNSMLLAFDRYGTIEDLTFIPDSNNQDFADLLNELATFSRSILNVTIVIIALTGGIMAWLFIRSKKDLKDLKDWQQAYLGHSYVTNFELNPPKGTSTVDRVVKAAAEIFPQIKYAKDYPELSSELSKTGRSTRFSKQVDQTSIDISLKTKEGWFIVKDYGDNEVALDDVKAIIKATKKYAAEEVFRVILVSNNYHGSLSDPEEHAIPDKLGGLPIDLLFPVKGGFYAMWIS